MRNNVMTTIGLVLSLAISSAAGAQDHSAALGGSMGTESAASPQSTSGSVASGAYHTPVAKSQRRHSTKSGTHAGKPSSVSGSSMGSGDMTSSANANPTNRH